MYQPEPPLSQRELRILRGMMDEYEYTRARARVFSGLFGDVRVLLAVLAAVMVLVMQGVQLYLIFGGHG